MVNHRQVFCFLFERYFWCDASLAETLSLRLTGQSYTKTFFDFCFYCSPGNRCLAVWLFDSDSDSDSESNSESNSESDSESDSLNRILWIKLSLSLMCRVWKNLLFAAAPYRTLFLPWILTHFWMQWLVLVASDLSVFLKPCAASQMLNSLA